jgi:hypothetical protein
MQINTLTGRGYKGKIYVKKTLENSNVIYCLWGGFIPVYLDGGRSPGLGPSLLHKGGVRLRLGVLHQERLVLTNQQTE